MKKDKYKQILRKINKGIDKLNFELSIARGHKVSITLKVEEYEMIKIDKEKSKETKRLELVEDKFLVNKLMHEYAPAMKELSKH